MVLSKLSPELKALGDAIILLIIATAIAGWVLGLKACFRSKGLRKRKRHFFLILGLVALSSCYLTLSFQYYTNENTQVTGFPINIVIFQREGPGEPWFDYINPVGVLALPLNFLLLGGFALVPYWLVARLIMRRARRTDSDGVQGPHT
jgi:hypothetical protein